jgi:dynein heavy chain 1
VQEYKEASKIVMTLKSEALKERHWKVLLKKLRIETIFADLTLGLLFELDLPTKSSVIDSVMLEAGDNGPLLDLSLQIFFLHHCLHLFARQLRCCGSVF